MSVLPHLPHALNSLTGLLAPLTGHAAAPAAAVVAFTVLVRLALHPLARAAARGERARAALAPRIAELRRAHERDPRELQRALAALHTAEGTSPLAGILPTLLQLPAFFVLYHAAYGTDLGAHWGTPVHAAVLAVVAAVALLSYRRARKAAPDATGLARHLPLLSFATLVPAAIMPPAAGLYLATSTTWTAAERAWLHRPHHGKGVAGDAPSAGGSPKTSDDRPHRK
ncbi:YidC/Oxa1 family membrane protein insertase [Streptomyces sp. NPDC088354]|uniref:YidC/Oxa1 family membrane protein insertase n=1 Tax=unclassified Streptomyces TaxID=2593676 RepID=UPI0029A84460|nr:YidC/Oxa1 family membrane protein insertase [Streptomyces sp. MI02-7b]MDX3077263.1 YidC/Oxa1 family membrane protein insertase [Streptomyces sp. MI02-7b]